MILTYLNDPRETNAGAHLEWVDISLYLEPVTKAQPEENHYFR